MNKINAAELKQLTDSHDEWALFDVRELGEAESGHVFGATFLPRRMLEFRISELVPARSTHIVVYDEGGSRAELAAATLASFGYFRVSVLDGGTSAWTEAGFPLTQGSNVPGKVFGERVCELAKTPSIAADELQSLRESKNSFLLCDIRTPEEYEIARVPGAFSAPGFDVALSASDFEKRGTSIVVHCAGRTRSIIACETLRRLGLPNVLALENGTMGWVLSELPLEKSRGVGRICPSVESRHVTHPRAKHLATSVGVSLASPEELSGWIESREKGDMNAYAFDVRQVYEYTEGHVPGVLALPGGQAVQRADEFTPVQTARIVFVDDDEVRALIAGYWYRQMGFQDVRVLHGGVAAWVASGRSLERGRARKPPLGLLEAAASAKQVSPEQLKEISASQSNAIILDVDTSRRYSEKHLVGARWLPRGWLEARIGDIAPLPGIPIVVTCYDGLQSMLAGGTLRRLGYEQVYVLSGGKRKAAGLAMENGMSEVDGEINDVILPPYAKGVDGMRRYLEWETKLTDERCQ